MRAPFERTRGFFFVCCLAAACLGCPGEPADPLAEARALHERGRYGQSLPRLRTLADENPGHPEINFLLGEALLRTGEASLALWPLRRAAESPEYAVEAGILLTRVMIQSRSKHDAVTAAARVLEIEPDNVTALELSAQAHLGINQFEETLADIDRVLALDPQNITVLVPRVLVLIQLERIDEAEEALATASHQLETTEREVTQSMRARLCVANGLFAFEKGEAERGEKQYETCLEEFPTDPVAVPEAAAFYDKIGKPERGTEVLQQAFEASNDPFFRAALAQRMRQQGNVAEEEALLRQEAEERPSARSWFALGDHYVRRDDYAAAAAAFEKALAATPEPQPMMRFAYADTLIQKGDYAKAEQVAAGLEQESLRDLIRGRSLLAQGDARGALAAFEAGLRLWPNNAAARFFAGQAAEQLADFDRAVAEYRESVRADAAHTEAGLFLARLYAAQGAHEGALEAVGKYARTHRGDPQGYLVAIRIAHAMGRRDVVVEGLTRLARMPGQAGKALAEEASLVAADKGPAGAVGAINKSPLDLTDPANAAALRVLLVQFAALEEHENARARVAAALEAHPEAAVFHDLRARSLRAAGRPDADVRAAFERAIELDPEQASALAGLAGLTAAAGEREAALALYDRAAAADPRDPQPARAAARLLASGPEAGDAQPRLEKLLEKHPQDAGTAHDLARLLATAGRDPDRALALAKRAALYGRTPETLETLGWIQLERGEPEQAVEALTQALELRPESAGARYRLGLALAAQGDEDAAREAFQAVLAGGASPEAERARAELARLEAGGSGGAKGE